MGIAPTVLEPSGFTLLSNNVAAPILDFLFWSPLDSHYSQTGSGNGFHASTFWSPLDSHYSQTYTNLIYSNLCFGALWIHTTLKHRKNNTDGYICFGALWIHTTLKRTCYSSIFYCVLEPSGFTLLSNYLLLQNVNNKFWSPLDSHYSQTNIISLPKKSQFWSPLDSHYSQTNSFNTLSLSSFGALWIHTTLKQRTLPNKMFKVLEPSGFTLLSN